MTASDQLPSAADTPEVIWVATTPQNPWQQRQIPKSEQPMGMPDVFVRTDQPQQAIDGFGAAFSELGWDALSLLSEPDREDVLKTLFRPGKGLGLTLCRTPIGASDYARDWYSYDETDGDLALDHFSIKRDQSGLIPFIHAAQRHQPALRLWASPWSPPTWMKRNRHYAAAMPHPMQGVENGLRPDQVGAEGEDLFRVEEPYLSAYAAYFGRYLDAYKAEGIDIEMVMPQNEFNSPQVFPSCPWTPGGLAKFVACLGSETQKRGTRLFLGTLERANPKLAQTILDDPVAGLRISGLGLQWAGKRALAVLRNAYPELPIYQSEQECGDGRNDWRYARYAWTLTRRFIEGGASVYLYWNMVLTEGGSSSWGWPQNSLVVVDPETRAYRYTPDCLVLRHVSQYVQPGANFLPTESFAGFDNQLAFANPDGSVVIVAQNDLAYGQPVSYLVGDRILRPTLPPDSFNTIVIRPRDN
jgi:glucosylceramidase